MACSAITFLSPASRVESHDLVVWLWTGVSSRNRPTNVLKSRKYCAHRLKARTLGVSGTPVSDAMGKLGDLRDCPGDKIRTLICSDWDPYSTFPFTDGLSCHCVSDLYRPLVIVRFRSILPPTLCCRFCVMEITPMMTGRLLPCIVMTGHSLFLIVCCVLLLVKAA